MHTGSLRMSTSAGARNTQLPTTARLLPLRSRTSSQVAQKSQRLMIQLPPMRPPSVLPKLRLQKLLRRWRKQRRRKMRRIRETGVVWEENIFFKLNLKPSLLTFAGNMYDQCTFYNQWWMFKKFTLGYKIMRDSTFLPVICTMEYSKKDS